jgi:adenylate cyclase
VGGVEVHAEALSAILDERTPYTPRIAAAIWPWLASALVSTLLLLSLRISRRGAGLVLPVVALFCLSGLFVLHTVILLSAHLWMGWITPAVFTILATSLLSGVELVRTRFERERVFQNLSSYLPESVARQVALQGPSAQIVAERHDATVMIVDLRNFSAYCEGRPPEETATVLHLFFTTATRIVEAHGGVMEHMMGDGFKAVWNGSSPCDNHSQRALASAKTLWTTLCAQLPFHSSRRTPALDVGIGIESGEVLVGSFGAAGRRVHSVLGETVTIASRLEALTGELAYPILLGPEIVARENPQDVTKLGDFLLAGLKTPRTLYALPVEIDRLRLRLIYEAEGEQLAVG